MPCSNLVSFLILRARSEKKETNHLVSKRAAASQFLFQQICALLPCHCGRRCAVGPAPIYLSSTLGKAGWIWHNPAGSGALGLWIEIPLPEVNNFSTGRKAKEMRPFWGLFHLPNAHLKSKPRIVLSTLWASVCVCLSYASCSIIIWTGMLTFTSEKYIV